MSDKPESSIRLKTARTLKWNTIDKVSSQLLYAVTGVVLANVLPREDFGLVGVILVFQAFAILFVDSGFGAALLQKKNTDERDYSTVFWFNLSVSLAVYLLLFFSAPLIADIFHDDKRLIPLSRVMFLNFIISGLGIIQTNRLMKQMDVKQIAVANVMGLVISGAIGIWLALSGAGAWALVWQTLILSSIKTGWLWLVVRWMPRFVFSIRSLNNIYRVGLGVFTSQLFNTIFLNIYSFVIGAYFTFASLGDYTQADKWSKMGSASISQILTNSFIPVLARVQDNVEEFHRLMKKINGFTAFLLYPLMIGLVAMAEPLFHVLFGTKWDSAIILFQILLIRGIFTVLTAVCNNYILALGYARSLVVVEVIKDTFIAVAIVATIFSHSVPALVWGQLIAGVVTFLFVLILTSRKTGYKAVDFCLDHSRYLFLTVVIAIAMWLITGLVSSPLLMLLLQACVEITLYIGILLLRRDALLAQSLDYVFGRYRKK